MSSSAPAWLLVDYGEVISTTHEDDATRRLADLAGLGVAEFRSRYWAERPAYDLGEAPESYWSRVLGRDPGDLTRTLTEVDIDGWMGLDPYTLSILVAYAAENEARLALLSNAPHALADAIERSAWAGEFEQLFYSARLGLMKPDPAVFTAVLERLGAAPQDVLFIDDRAENTAAAAAMGIATVTFTSSAALADALGQSRTASTSISTTMPGGNPT